MSFRNTTDVTTEGWSYCSFSGLQKKTYINKASHMSCRNIRTVNHWNNTHRFSFLVWYGLKWPTVNRKKNSIYYLQINRIIYKNLIWSNNYNSILRIALFFYCSQDDINSNIRNNNTYTCVPCTWHCGRDTLGLDTISHSMTNLLMVMSLLYSIKLLWIDVWLNNGYSFNNKAKLGYPIRMTFCFDDDMTCSIVSSHVTSIRNVI